MMKLYLMAATAGLGAGGWPLVMKPANLGGGAIAISYCVFSLAAALFLFVVVEKLQAPAQAGVPAGGWWAIARRHLAGAALFLPGIRLSPSVPRKTWSSLRSAHFGANHRAGPLPHGLATV